MAYLGDPIMSDVVPAETNEAGSTARDVDVHLSVRLRELRSRAKLSQAALAGRLGVSPAMIHWYEIGQSRISASTLFVLAEILGCTIADFYFGLDEAVAGPVDPSHSAFAAVLVTRSGPALVEAYPKVPQAIQDDLVALTQLLARP